MNVIPLFDRVLVLPIDDVGQTKGGLLVPDIARNSTAFGYGTVIAVGPGRNDSNGVQVKVKLKDGDTVMYPRRVGVVVPIPQPDGSEVDHILFREPEIFAKCTDLPKPSMLLDAAGKQLLSMQPVSRAKPDVGYENAENLELAKRAGFVDINPDGTTDYVDDPE